MRDADQELRRAAGTRSFRAPGHRRPSVPVASVVDVFCGAGGLSHGFRLEGFNVAAGIDTDEDCRHPFEHNNEASFICRDVTSVTGRDVVSFFPRRLPRVLVGCAPCQPFSTYNHNNSDPRWKLLAEFGRLVSQTKPAVVSMENVPRLSSFRNGKLFNDFLTTLRRNGYHVDWQIAYAPDYGVPQRRTRLVLLASLLGDIKLDGPTHARECHPTVKDAIGRFPALEAGDIDANDPLHRCSGLSPRNQARIRASVPGGSWRDWDQSLVAACHKTDRGSTYSSVYGRMKWDAPAPTITTLFYGFGNGRFGHPDQDRALSLREGAVLQSFPPNYDFVASNASIRFKALGRMIGNAVPVLLARAIARSIRSHLEAHAL